MGGLVTDCMDSGRHGACAFARWALAQCGLRGPVATAKDACASGPNFRPQFLQGRRRAKLPVIGSAHMARRRREQAIGLWRLARPTTPLSAQLPSATALIAPRPSPPRPQPPLPTPRLQLEQAIQLLRQSGQAPPEGDPASEAWLQSLVDALVDLSSKDALTGLANRRSFELALSREIDRVARSGEPALLLALDIDLFKSVNDQHGHQAGDQVLKEVAKALLESVRPMDLVARIGGEEFAIVMPHCPAHFGQAVAERVRQRVHASVVPISPTKSISVSVSIGGAFAPQWVRSTPTVWIERADLQLYRAKQEGRNRVCLEPAAVCEVSAEEKELLFEPLHHQDFE